LIGADGEQVGVVSREEALRISTEAKLDLVEISPNAEPPVCRVMDFGKHIFNERKKKAASKKKQKQTQVKEIKIRPGIEEADFQVKLRNMLKFLDQGDKVKVSMRFRGREITHHELGREVMEKVRVGVEEFGEVESEPKLEGRQMIMVFAPKK